MDISHAQNHASAMNKLQIDGSIDYKNKKIIHHEVFSTKSAKKISKRLSIIDFT
jgi:hypothetical protein